MFKKLYQRLFDERLRDKSLNQLVRSLLVDKIALAAEIDSAQAEKALSAVISYIDKSFKAGYPVALDTSLVLLPLKNTKTAIDPGGDVSFIVPHDHPDIHLMQSEPGAEGFLLLRR